VIKPIIIVYLAVGVVYAAYAAHKMRGTLKALGPAAARALAVVTPGWIFGWPFFAIFDLMFVLGIRKRQTMRAMQHDLTVLKNLETERLIAQVLDALWPFVQLKKELVGKPPGGAFTIPDDHVVLLADLYDKLLSATGMKNIEIVDENGEAP